MLLALIPLTWLAVSIVLLALCRIAASADRELRPAAQMAGAAGERVLLTASSPIAVSPGPRRAREAHRQRGLQPARRRPVSSHGMR
jgi:hypothetical protein